MCALAFYLSTFLAFLLKLHLALLHFQNPEFAYDQKVRGYKSWFCTFCIGSGCQIFLNLRVVFLPFFGILGIGLDELVG